MLDDIYNAFMNNCSSYLDEESMQKILKYTGEFHIPVSKFSISFNLKKGNVYTPTHDFKLHIFNRLHTYSPSHRFVLFSMKMHPKDASVKMVWLIFRDVPDDFMEEQSLNCFEQVLITDNYIQLAVILENSEYVGSIP